MGQDGVDAATLERLHHAAIRLLRGLRRVDEATGLTGPRLSALSVIVFGGPLGLTALAHAERVRVPTMSRLVGALEQEGLIERRSDPADGRATLIRATTRGRRVIKAGRARRIRALADAAAGLTPGDRERLGAAASLLDALADGLATANPASPA